GAPAGHRQHHGPGARRGAGVARTDPPRLPRMPRRDGRGREADHRPRPDRGGSPSADLRQEAAMAGSQTPALTLARPDPWRRKADRAYDRANAFAVGAVARNRADTTSVRNAWLPCLWRAGP